jgi:hypothetical protein
VEEEQKWGDETTKQGNWLSTTSIPTSSYSPFAQQNPGTSARASFSPPTSNAISQQNISASNNGSSQPLNLDANQQEQEWRDSTSTQDGWWNEEKLDYYTDRGMRVTRSFTGEGTRTDIS